MPAKRKPAVKPPRAFRPVPIGPPSAAEIDDVINQCWDAENEGRSAYFGMSFEQGVRMGIEWATGRVREHPFE